MTFDKTLRRTALFDDDFNAINVLAMVATARRTPLAL
jgi:hypothetical protein